MQAKSYRLFGLGFLFILLSGCHTTIHVNTPKDSANNHTKSIDNVFVLVNSASFPKEFIDAFGPALETELQNVGIRVSVRQDSGLDLIPVTEDDFKSYSNLMTMRIYYRYQGDGRSFFTMIARLIDLETNQEIMNSRISVASQLGLTRIGWGEDGAKNTAQKLIQKMQQLGILQVKA